MLALDLRDATLLRFRDEVPPGVVTLPSIRSAASGWSLESTLETVEALLVRRGFGVAVTFAWEISSSPSISLLSTASDGVGAFLGRPRTRGAFVAFVAFADAVDVSAAAADGTDRRTVLVFLGAGSSGSKGDSSRAFDVKEISSSSSDSMIARLATRRDGREEAMTLRWAVARCLFKKRDARKCRRGRVSANSRDGKPKSIRINGQPCRFPSGNSRPEPLVVSQAEFAVDR